MSGPCDPGNPWRAEAAVSPRSGAGQPASAPGERSAGAGRWRGADARAKVMGSSDPPGSSCANASWKSRQSCGSRVRSDSSAARTSASLGSSAAQMVAGLGSARFRCRSGSFGFAHAPCRDRVGWMRGGSFIPFPPMWLPRSEARADLSSPVHFESKPSTSRQRRLGVDDTGKC
jgi:hypothetical protein